MQFKCMNFLIFTFKTSLCFMKHRLHRNLPWVHRFPVHHKWWSPGPRPSLYFLLSVWFPSVCMSHSANRSFGSTVQRRGILLEKFQYGTCGAANSYSRHIEAPPGAGGPETYTTYTDPLKLKFKL